jgi:TatD DNase family protein
MRESIEQQNDKIYTYNSDKIFSDAHCHLNLFDNYPDVIKSAIKAGINIMVTAGGSMKDNIELSSIAKGNNVYGVIGISPDFAMTNEKDVNKLVNLAKNNSNIVGIGEIGLDYKIALNENDINLQKNIFISQIKIANSLEMPLVIHSRMAIEDTLNILKEYSTTRVMFHFFEGNENHAKIIESNNYLISIPPLESNRRSKVIKAISINNIVGETDSPVVGKTPEDVIKSLQFIASSKGITLENAAIAATKNLRAFFSI